MEIAEAFEESAVFETYGTSLQTKDLDGNDLIEKYDFFDQIVENKKKTFSFCVFSSKVTLELIKRDIPIQDRHILMDATFRIVPVGPFKQLLIIYIRKHHKVIFMMILILVRHVSVCRHSFYFTSIFICNI